MTRLLQDRGRARGHGGERNPALTQGGWAGIHRGTPRCVNDLYLTLPAEPAAAALARQAVTRYAVAQGAINGTVAAIALAVSEAVTNAILHAYRDRPVAGELTVIGEREGDELRLLVRDLGDGVRPRVDSPGLGLGLAIIGRVTRSLEVREAPGGGAEIRMSFALR